MMPGDGGIISDLHVKSWKKYYRGIVSDDYLKYSVEQERLDVWLDRCEHPAEDQLLLVAEAGDSPCGFVCAFAHHHEQWGAYIDNLHVSTDYQGRGIGLQLLSRIAKKIHTFDPGIQECYLWVFEQNQKATGFYERIGGRRGEKQNRDCPDGRSYPCFRYSWQVVELASDT